ncbi:MAG: MATE family efflux transporter [Myxococcota bacterium]
MSTLLNPAELRQLLSLAWPVVVSRSAQAVIGFSDAAMVGQLGEAELAATSAGALNSFSLFILPMGTVFIVSSFASQLCGQGDHAGARRYGWYGLGVSLVAGLISLASAPFTFEALGVFDYEPRVRELMATYLTIRLLSGFAAVGMEALGNYFGGMGNTRVPMLAGVLAMVLNVFFNWVLIFGKLGAPALGVAGAAWASTISTVIAFGVLFWMFWKGKGVPGGRVDSSLNGAEFVRMLRFGIPSGFNWFFEFAAFSFFMNVVFTSLGTTPLAALMAVIQLNSIAFMPAFGISSAGAILVGQAIGAGHKDLVPMHVARTVLVAAGWQGLVGLAYLVAPAELMRFFVSAEQESGELVRIGAQMMFIAAAWQLFDASATALAESLRAAGDTTFTLWARIVAAWAIMAPGSLLTVRAGGNHNAALWWIVIYVALLAGVLLWRFRRGAWRNIQLTEASLAH